MQKSPTSRFGSLPTQANTLASESLVSAFDAATRSSAAELILISVDNMAMIINTHGQATSDIIMSEILREIQGELPAQSHIERIQIDRFAAIVPHITPEGLEILTNGILHHVRAYCLKSTLQPLFVICSMGSVCMPTSATTLPSALQLAHVALSSVGGDHYQSYENTLASAGLGRKQMELASSIQSFISTDRFRLAFQPIVDTTNGHIEHYECLLRLIADDGAISSAGALIPVAEKMGMIDVIDRLVLRKTIDELLLSPNVNLAFNVSSLTTGNAKWLAEFTELLEQHPEIAHRLTVEVTETAAHEDMRDTAYFIASVQALGAKVALDDFGTGYTSFRQLKNLSVDLVKIDGSFIRNVMDSQENQFFVKTLLELVNAFGMHAVAECVETGDQAKYLMEQGVHYMQGYYFGKPLLQRPWLSEGEYKAG